MSPENTACISMNNYRIFTIFLATALLGACSYGEKFRNMETDHFTVEMAPYLSKVHNVHPEAQVQGRNNYRDVYFLVLEHDRSASDSVFQNNLDSISFRIKSTLRDPFVEKDSSYTVNGLPVIQRKLTGTTKDKRLVFNIALVRGKNYDYEISGWMFNSKRSLWLDDIQQSISSFREK